MKNTIALMVKVWNEEFFLPFMLQYYETLGVDAIYIFDGGSTDKTMELLEDWCDNKTRFLIQQEQPHEEWFVKTVSEGKLINDAVELITNDGFDWIIKLDADEIFTINMSEQIKHIQKGYSMQHGYAVPRIHLIQSQYKMIWGNLDDNSVWYPDYNFRLINVKKNDWKHIEILALDTQMLPRKTPAITHPLSEKFFIIHLHFLFEGRRIKRHGITNLDEGFKVETSNYDIRDCNIDHLIPPMFKEWYEKQLFEWSKNPEKYEKGVK